MAHPDETFTLQGLLRRFWGGETDQHSRLLQWVTEGKTADDLFSGGGGGGGGGGGMPTFLPRPGRFVIPHGGNTGQSTTLALNTHVGVPVWLQAPLTVDQAAIQVTAPAAGSQVRLGVYAHDESLGAPGALISPLGAPLDTTTSGVKSVTVADLVLPAGQVWLTAVAQGAAVGVNGFSLPYYFLANSTTLDTTKYAGYAGQSASGALPPDFGALTSLLSFGPLIGLRRKVGT